MVHSSLNVQASLSFWNRVVARPDQLASSSFSECTFVGQVSAIELTCDAAMTLTGTAVEAPGSPALQFDGAVINGDLDPDGAGDTGAGMSSRMFVGWAVLGSGNLD